MKIFLTLILSCYLQRTWTQELLGPALFSVPSMDDILRNTNALENAVMDLSIQTDLSGAQSVVLPDHKDSVFHGSNVHGTRGSNTVAGRFDDLASIGNAGLGFRGNAGVDATVPLNSPFDPPPGITLADRDHSAAPHIVANMGSPVSVTDGFLSSTDGFSSAGESGISTDSAHLPTGGGSVHVDLPGVHGNPVSGSPILHRDAVPVNGRIPGTTHMDFAGHHGNPVDGIPLVHRDGRGAADTRGSLRDPAGGLLGHGLRPGMPIGSVHVDMPGEHGNPIDGVPVIHREGPPLVSRNQHPVSSAANVHVDIPGQHGNQLGGEPVVHRGLATSVGPHGGTLVGNVHIDLPGEHGNPINGQPVVHRETHAGTIHGAQTGNVHVDLPGQHGHPVGGSPVVHRETHAGTSLGAPIGNVHVDMPGQHGNPVDGLPLVHREHGPLGHNLGTPVGSVHVDLPGEHGNPIDGVPVIHREGPHPGLGSLGGQVRLAGGNVGTAGGIVHVDMPGQHGNPLGNHPVVHRDGGPHGSTQHGHTGIHIDAPGEHGNQLNEPALHLPPGATIEDAIAAGVIPHPENVGRAQIAVPGVGFGLGFDPSLPVNRPSFSPGFPLGPSRVGTSSVVPTGVLPGTPNIAVPPRHISGPAEHQDHMPSSGNVHLTRPGSGSSLGDLLGIPSITLPGRVPIAGLDKGLEPTNWGIAGDGNILVTRESLGDFSGRPRRRWRGNGRGRRGRRQGTTIVPTTTTAQSPSNPNSGITIIRPSRPNPLGALGDAVREVLTGGGSGGGGLLGSLIQSALGVSGAPSGAPGGGPIVIRPVRGSFLGGLFG